MKKTLLSILPLSFLVLIFSSCIGDDYVETPTELISDKTCNPNLEDTNEIFKVVEDSPAFPGCEDILNKSEKKKCAEEKMLEFIYGNLIYPQQAIDEGIEGTVVVSFTVGTDGCISHIKVIKDIGGGCGHEALRICELMPDWEPGEQRGNPVRVQFNLPIKFKL